MTYRIALIFVAGMLVSCGAPSSETTFTTQLPADQDYWSSERMHEAEPMPMPAPQSWWQRLMEYVARMFDGSAENAPASEAPFPRLPARALQPQHLLALDQRVGGISRAQFAQLSRVFG